MKKKLLMVSAALVWLSGSMAVAQTVDEVVEKHVQAMGGADKLNSLKSVRISSKMQVMGTEVTQTATAVHQKALRQDINAGGMTMTQVVEGDKGWGINPMMGQNEPTPTPDEQVKLMADQMDLTGSLFNFKNKGNTVELVGKEALGTADTYKLKVTKKNGGVEMVNLDAKSFLPLRVVVTAKVQGQDFRQEMTNSNFQQVDGITFPFAMEVKNDAIPGGGPIMVTVSKVEVNPTIDETIFKMPAKK
ncbi:outer membrane lipoprotein-sorting protein [Larkinella soli]|uniref:outer membrane lipoprotein-sorting protein n=1 Tax=Larkinella soli TaxID=1770527 RepID=UPI000FFB0D9C|nr:outer membrane lipoprotein-sorting protein [Larkinella soli]